MSTTTLDELNQKVAELRDSHAAALDPVRFAYLEGLCARLNRAEHASNAVLLETAGLCLHEYQTYVDEQTQHQSELASSMKQEFPELIEQINAHCERHELAQLQALSESLRDSAPAEQSVSELSELVAALSPLESVETSDEAEPSFDEMLALQELAARDEHHASDKASENSLVTGLAAGPRMGTPNDGSGEQLELHSMKYFRESLKYQQIDNMIDRALNECPANPGPHNPQMLAVKALSQMKALSPQYIRRFAGYVETMLWIQKNHSKLSS